MMFVDFTVPATKSATCHTRSRIRTMAFRLFERTEHAKAYNLYHPGVPDAAFRAIMDYVRAKTGGVPSLAVDVGCGSGQCTQLLSTCCTRVVGVDVSEAMIREATRVNSTGNIAFTVGTAEKLPFLDGSVGLLCATSAANVFNLPDFVREAARVLQPGGCLAIYAMLYPMRLKYGGVSSELTAILHEMLEELRPYEHERMSHLRNGYADIYTGITFADKERKEGIELSVQVTLQDLLRFIGCFSEYQALRKEDPQRGDTFMQSLEQRLQEAMGRTAPDTELELNADTAVLLACKTPTA
ncbi:putative methyltransferase DDB_G0268948 isoform X2 [Lampetra planeri]